MSIGAYYGDSINASASTTENLIIASESVTDSPQRDLVILTGSDEHAINIKNAVVLEYGADIETITTGLGKEIYNTQSNAIIIGTATSDTIVNSDANDVYVNASAGNDMIITNGRNSTVSSGAGKNLVSLTGAETGTAEGLMIALLRAKTQIPKALIAAAQGESDTLYFVNGVENKAIGFTDKEPSFWTDTVMGDSDYLKVTLLEVKDVVLINLKYGSGDVVKLGIADDGKVYDVTNGAADLYIGGEVRFKGVDESVTIDISGKCQLNDRVVTLSLTSSLKSSASGLSVYTAGEITAAAAKNALLAYNPNAKIYNVSETENIRGLEDEKL